MYITVNFDERGICEVFSTLGKAGGCASAQLEAICRLVSLTLRSGVDIVSTVKQLRGIRCPSIAWGEGKAVLSCADAIATVLAKQTKNSSENTGLATDTIAKVADNGPVRNLAGQCPECGDLLVYQEGCFICSTCGYTKC
jgi:ribonucleoside-diphosphate reductase alpha chain